VRDKFAFAQISLNFAGEIEDPNLEREDWDFLLRWLMDQRLIFHNAKYDLMMMRAGTRHWRGIDLITQFWWDTMLVTGVLEPAKERGLDAVSKRHGFGGKENKDAVKGWLKKHKYPTHRYDLVPWDIIEKYVTTDAEDTADVYRWQCRRLEEFANSGNPESDRFHDMLIGRIEREHLAMRANYEMERRGIGYDDETSLQAADILEERARDIERTMPFNVRPKETHGYFISKLGLKTDRTTKEGKPSIDEQQVRKWIAEDVPFATEYSHVSKARRAVSMWYRGYPEKMGPDGRLRTVFKQGDVKSGRFAVERVQLQAIPKADKYSQVGSADRLAVFQDIPDVRDLIHPREGYGLWNLDLSQAELRVATHYAKCRLMQEQLANGEDIHSNNTIELELCSGPEDPRWKAWRDIAKRTTFGGIFQIGAETFQDTLAKLANVYLPIEECEAIIRKWRRRYPEFGDEYRRQQRKAYTEKYVYLLPFTPLEERSYFTDYDRAQTAWNRVVQGSLAIVFKMWMGEVERSWPGHLVLMIHDSLVLECPLDEGDEIAHEVAAYGRELTTNAFETDMRVDIDRWDKVLETV
jgi:DNA polymerase I-like protein with 3'-5' exonuclease and polymerase domains